MRQGNTTKVRIIYSNSCIEDIVESLRVAMEIKAWQTAPLISTNNGC